MIAAQRGANGRAATVREKHGVLLRARPVEQQVRSLNAWLLAWRGLRFVCTHADNNGHGKRQVRFGGLGQIRLLPELDVLLAAGHLLVVGLGCPDGHRLCLL